MHSTQNRNAPITALILLLLTALLFAESPASAAGERSLRFYGSGSTNIDRVRIPLANRPVNVSGSFTIEFWMKASAAQNGSNGCSEGGVAWTQGNVIVDRDIFGDGDYGDYGISLFGGEIAFGTTVGPDSNANTICSGVNVADGQWHHIAVTRNGNTGQIQIYVDGVRRAQGSGAAGDISYRVGRTPISGYEDSDPYLVFGAEKHDFPGSLYYNGWLDDLRISNTVRYTTSSFSRPTAPHALDANTVALYRFDEGSGSTIVDANGGQSNGERLVGGSPAGPIWSTDIPFGSVPPPTFDEWCYVPLLNG